MYNIIKLDLNTGESINLSYNLFDLYRLERGKVLDLIEYQQLKKESDKINCKRKALTYLSIRARSSLEMEKYLSKKEFLGDVIREVIGELKKSDYINDYNYAVMYINSKNNRKIVGENLLKRDLYKKGVSREIVRKSLKKCDVGSVDFDKVYAIAIKKLQNLGNKKNKMSKLVYFLKYRGFNDNTIHVIIDRLKNEGFGL